MMFNFTFKAGLLRWRSYAFLAGADHANNEIIKWTRQNNLQSATVPLQVVIGLCRRKETAALKIKAAASNGRVDRLLYDGFFFFCRRAAACSFCVYLNKQSSQKCHRHTLFRQNNGLKSHEPVRFEKPGE